MCSDSIHDSVWCAERRGRTPGRSIDAAIVKDPTYGCDCRLANGIYRHSLSKRSQKPPMRSGFRGISRRRPALRSSSTSRKIASNSPVAISRFIHSSHLSSFQPWNQAASWARALRTRAVRLECWSRPSSGPIIDADPDHPGTCAFRLRTQLPLCRINGDRLARRGLTFLLRVFSCDLPDLACDRNRLKRIRSGKLL